MITLPAPCRLPSLRIAAVLMGLVSILAVTGVAHASPSQGQLAARQAAIVVTQTTSVATSSGGALDSRGNLEGNTATIPRQATDGVHIGNDQNAVVISLTDADNTASGVVSDGVMTYNGSKQNSQDKIIPTSDGAQFLKVLDNASAPETFSYHIQVPAGGKLVQVTNGPDGLNHTSAAALGNP